MSETLIEIRGLTKDYGEGRGIFDINLDLYRGEILGFVGANGAGKTTTLRHIMGFIQQDSGTCKVCGIDCWKQPEKTKKYLGYVPGEIAFPDLSTGTEFLKSQAEFWGVKDLSFGDEMTKTLQLDPTANLKRMSKGMKQKTALIAAGINDPDILILDEPTTGLDPLMRVALLDMLKEEQKKGKTIIISSHLYEELEAIADRVAIIDKGHIVKIVDMNLIRHRPVIDLKIEFKKKKDYDNFKSLKYNIIRDQKQYNQVTICISKNNMQKLFQDLKKFDVKFMSQIPYTLEKYINETIKNEKGE